MKDIHLKSPDEVAKMAEAGRVVAHVLETVEAAIAPGVSTMELELIARDTVAQTRATPAFLNHPGSGNQSPFPACLCVSVNEAVVHGVPGARELQAGDLVGVDFGCELDGFFADSAKTFPVGDIDPKNRRLMDVTLAALSAGIQAAQPGNRLMAISGAIEDVIRPHGFGIVKDLMGHGIGRHLHEGPSIPNYVPWWGRLTGNVRLRAGMVLAIEPMVCAGGGAIEVVSDGWTVVTRDRSWSAHFEHTIAITKDGPIILTLNL